jgi:hypothetical protein
MKVNIADEDVAPSLRWIQIDRLSGGFQRSDMVSL